MGPPTTIMNRIVDALPSLVDVTRKISDSTRHVTYFGNDYFFNFVKLLSYDVFKTCIWTFNFPLSILDETKFGSTWAHTSIAQFVKLKIIMYRKEGNIESEINVFSYIKTFHSDPEPILGVVGEKLKIFRTFEAYPRPQVKWSLQNSGIWNLFLV